MDTILLKTNKGSTKGLPEDHSKNVPKSLGWQISAPSHVWSPPTDLVETDEKFVVRVEIAGLRDQDFSVTLDKNYLVIAGSRPDIAERRAYHQMEIRFGEFSTVVALPGPVNPEKTVAEYSDGFLEVTLPKSHPK